MNTLTGDSATRDRVIEATVACILERGYYRASTNEIARTAGVTWGVIQHYFGTREGLMLAVLQDGASQFVAIVEDVEIDGETVTERMNQLLDIFFGRTFFEVGLLELTSAYAAFFNGGERVVPFGIAALQVAPRPAFPKLRCSMNCESGWLAAGRSIFRTLTIRYGNPLWKRRRYGRKKSRRWHSLGSNRTAKVPLMRLAD